jgi:FAD/FMN-containing dehydrogenase
VHARTRAKPYDTDALAALVARTAARGGHVRVVGTGHSSSDILRSDDVLISLDDWSGIIAVDPERKEARVRPSTTLDNLGARLYEHDLALPNYGDVATQTIAGAVGTGTHGSGRTLQNLSQMLVGATMVDGMGHMRRFRVEDGVPFRAAQVALGTLGIFTELTLRLVPTYDLERREYATSTDAALDHLKELIAGNRSFDFYWYPRRDDVKLRLLNPLGGGVRALPYARLLERTEGHSHRVTPTHTGIPHHFEECEYAMPIDQGPRCFRAVRARILDRWRATVGWRVLYRTVAADNALLSSASGHDIATISLHQNATLPWAAFFADIEQIFRSHGGRPHWAKKHGMHAAEIAPLYPHWKDFHGVRAQCDPHGVFLSPSMRALFFGAEA